MPKKKSQGADGGPLTPAVFHILLALSDGALHGYGVMQSVEQTAGLEMGPGTIYGSIQRMEDAGLVREAAPPANEGQVDSRRRYYALTADGRKALELESERVARLAELVRDKKLLPGGGSSR
jgi:DNA-binding PadR family transcriptional regulator